jgi:hypothetical protein
MIDDDDNDDDDDDNDGCWQPEQAACLPSPCLSVSSLP